MKICGMTQKGKEKKENEDRILIGRRLIDNDGLAIFDSQFPILVAVADGVGGNKGGASASHTVTQELASILDSNNVDSNLIREKIYQINRKVIDESIEKTELNKMATTLTGIYLDSKCAWIFHVGNTRIYISQGKYLKQLTRDHTTLNWMLKSGMITIEESTIFDKKNEITNCIGGGNEALLEGLTITNEVELFANVKKVIITSDGIHDYVEIDDLELILGSDLSEEDMCSQIILNAQQKGSHDDLSIVILSV